MSTARYVHWQDGEMWLGYFEEFPDYITHGDSTDGLEENLRDLYKDLTVKFHASAELPSSLSDEANRRCLPSWL